MGRRLIIILSLSFLFFAKESWSEIYKYKDADGNWHFSDKPRDSQNSILAGTPAKKGGTRTSTDIQRVLEDRYKPQSALESATLAVVKVKTALGSGSGFFINDSGYLITNKHVVRPTQDQIEETERQLAKRSNWLERRRTVINSRKSYLSEEKRDLDRYKDYINGLSSAERDNEQRKFSNRKKNYLAYKKQTKQLDNEYKKLLAEYRSSKSEFDSKRSSAAVSQQFKVVFKNSRSLVASLVALSETDDLALLKVDDHKTPFLTLAKNHSARQTDQVYAIGSPLGNKDHITAGIVTSLKKNRIYMDAQILPGNSGGPLINSEGEVIGVNTWKHYSRAGSIAEGFGIAISINVVKDEFNELVLTTNTAQTTTTSTTMDEGLFEAIMKGYEGAGE